MGEQKIDGHEIKWAPLGGGMLDQIICSCGWESKTYFDGAEYAQGEWKRHVQRPLTDSRSNNSQRE